MKEKTGNFDFKLSRLIHEFENIELFRIETISEIKWCFPKELKQFVFYKNNNVWIEHIPDFNIPIEKPELENKFLNNELNITYINHYLISGSSIHSYRSQYFPCETISWYYGSNLIHKDCFVESILKGEERIPEIEKQFRLLGKNGFCFTEEF